MAVKRYNTKEPLVFVFAMIPYVLIMNLLLFGGCVFDSAALLGKSVVYNCIYFFIIYFIFGSVAVLVRKSFASDSDLFRRIGIMLPLFYIMNFGAVKGLILLYENFNLLACPIKPNMYGWSVLYGCIMSTVITFINEGVANWENWKASLAENERLKNAYERSRLLGLKGQINPHFLFNCFNTLSGLIHEDEASAEKFLEEMTKVHRYLLRGDNELLVSVADEIKFASSYLYLTKTRFGSAIDANVNVRADLQDKFVPPLSMQVILENIIYTNAISKADPLYIEIKEQENTEIYIRHSIHEKTISQSLEVDEGLDNLLNKYRLLNAPPITIDELNGTRTIVLPILEKRVLHEAS